MRRAVLFPFLVLLLLLPSFASTQTPGEFLQQGLEAFEAKDWDKAERLLLKSLYSSDDGEQLTLEDEGLANWYLGNIWGFYGDLDYAHNAYSRTLEIEVETLGWDHVSAVSTHGTDLGKLIREDFWLIVTIME